MSSYQSHVQMLAGHQKFVAVGTGFVLPRAAANDDETLPRASKGTPKAKK